MKRVIPIVLVVLLVTGGVIYAQDPETLSYGDRVNGTITADATSITYAFEGTAEDNVTITTEAANPDDLVLAVALLGPDSEEVDRSNRGVLEEIILAETGAYQIVVEAVIGEGTFSLTLNRKAPENLDRLVLYSETFDDNSAGWEIQNQAGYITSSIEEGVASIRFTPRDPGSGWFITPGFEDWDLAPIFSPEYYYEVEIDGVSSTNSHYIVSLFFAVTENYDSYYYFTINQDGLLRYYPDFSFSYEDIYIPSVDFTDGKHTLGIYVREETILISIDGTIVYEITDTLAFDLEGTIGFMIGADIDLYGTQEATFDNVLVRSISNTDRQAISDYDNGCIIESQQSAANLRAEPSTTAARTGSLPFEGRARVIGQTTGADDFVWWQLAADKWVRSDIVLPVSGCSRVPVVEP